MIDPSIWRRPITSMSANKFYICISKCSRLLALAMAITCCQGLITYRNVGEKDCERWASNRDSEQTNTAGNLPHFHDSQSDPTRFTAHISRWVQATFWCGCSGQINAIPWVSILHRWSMFAKMRVNQSHHHQILVAQKRNSIQISQVSFRNFRRTLHFKEMLPRRRTLHYKVVATSLQ